MKTFWTVATREFAAKRLILSAGIGAAILMYLSPLVPGASRANPAEVMAIVSLFLGSAFAIGSALLVGATLFGPDLSERRIAWYFSRPIPAAALWWGKLAGGYAAVLLASAIAWTPEVFGGRVLSLMSTGAPAGLIAAIVAASLLLILVIANALSIALRSHSLWLLADATCLAASGAFLWAGARVLLRAGAAGSLTARVLILVGVLFVALVLAGWRQVAAGRVDPKRAHAVMSTALWSIVVSASLLMAGWAAWATAYGPSDLTATTFNATPGRWQAVAGTVSGRGPEFSGFVLADPATGRFERLSPGAGWTLTISRDGRRAAWAEPDSFSADAPATVMTFDLAAPAARPEATKIVLAKTRDLSVLTLSPDGSRIAIIAGGNLAVHDVQTGALLGSVHLAEGAWRGRRLFYESPSLLEVYSGHISGGAEKATVLRFDVAKRRLEKTAEIDCSGAKSTFLRLSPGGDRFLLSSASAGLVLLDGADGRRLASLVPPDHGAGVLQSLFLADGRIAAADRSGNDVTLRLFSKAGAPEGAIPLGNARTCRLGGEVSPGRLSVLLSQKESGDEGAKYRRIMTADFSTGSVIEIGKDLTPVTPALPWLSLSDSTPGPGSLGPRLFRSRDGRLSVLDPATNHLTPFSFGGR